MNKLCVVHDMCVHGCVCVCACTHKSCGGQKPAETVFSQAPVFLFFLRQGLRSPRCPRTHCYYVDQVGLKFTSNSPTSAEIKGIHHHTWLQTFFFFGQDFSLNLELTALVRLTSHLFPPSQKLVCTAIPDFSVVPRIWAEILTLCRVST